MTEVGLPKYTKYITHDAFSSSSKRLYSRSHGVYLDGRDDTEMNCMVLCEKLEDSVTGKKDLGP